MEPLSTLSASVQINQPLDLVWKAWTESEHIKNWHFALESWCCPQVCIDPQEDGRFSYRMEAKDGSMGFDFEGTFDEVRVGELIRFTLDDGREVQVLFSSIDGGTEVKEIFEAEKQNPIELQEQGWQAILNNFKFYVESLEP